MKSIKKAILLTVCVLMGALSHVLAQPIARGGVNAPGIQNLITEYGDELELTDAQKNELIALQLEHRNQFRTDNRQFRRGDRHNLRRDRNGARRGSNSRGVRKMDSEPMQTPAMAGIEMRQEVLDILTDEQIEKYQAGLIEKAERAHEFRTFQYQYMVEEAGIEDSKAEKVLSLLNSQSESRLELISQRILNVDELHRDMRADRFQQIKDTDNELRNILTVDEYKSLHKNLGFADRSHRRPERRNQRRGR